MTIKDMEQKTGISKANIRFYEAEGLIAPDRSPNGYRSYQEAHAEQLMRIKLLRSLDIPIEVLKELCNHRITLVEALSSRCESFEEEHSRLALSELVIGKMLETGEEYDTLDVLAYMALLTPGEPAVPLEPKLNLPWRRFWARTLDSAAYGLMIYLIVPSVLSDHLSTLIDTVLGLVLTILLEPVLLHCFGTTIGKWVFGIRVTALDGSRLTYEQAKTRTLLVMQYGYGLGIPFLSEYFKHKSLETSENGGELIWEQDSELTFRDSKLWRYPVFLVMLAGLMAVPALREYQRIFREPEEVTFYQGESPFTHDYKVEKVLYTISDEPAQLPLICGIFHPREGLAFYLTPYPSEYQEFIGDFIYCPPEEDPSAGVWSCHQEEKTYKLTVDPEENVILDYLEYGVLQWSWKLSRIDQLFVRGNDDRNGGLIGGFAVKPKWFELGSYREGISIPAAMIAIEDTGTMTLVFNEDAGETITLTEEIHIGDQVTIQTHTLMRNELGTYVMDIQYIDSEQNVNVIYRVPYDNGEYVFRVKH